MFSLFRQRRPKGFDLATRYYDAERERRDERLRRLRNERDGDAVRQADRELLSSRMRHSWQRRSSDGAHISRMLLALALVLLILYVLAKRFGLFDHWNG